MTFAKLVSYNGKLKKARKSEGNIFTIYSPKKVTIEQADTVTIKTDLVLKLPEQSKAYLVTKFTGQYIKELVDPTKQGCGSHCSMSQTLKNIESTRATSQATLSLNQTL